MLSKSDVGKTFFLVPTGNTVRRGVIGGSYSQIVEAKLTKLAPVNGEFSPHLGGCWTISFKVKKSFNYGERRNIHCSDNSGYDVYKTLDEIKKHRIAVKTRKLVIDKVDSFDDETMAAIAKIANLTVTIED